MKPYLGNILLALSLLVNVGVVASAWFQAHHAEYSAEHAFFGMGHDQVPDYLQLDPAQRERWHELERDFVSGLNDAGREIEGHRERLVNEIFSGQPDPALIESERTSIFALQEAQQRSVIAQLLKERAMLNPKQRSALAELLLKQDPPGR